MSVFDFTHLSKRNKQFRKRTVGVANGAKVTVLDMTDEEVAASSGVIYLHVHRISRKAYVGITVMRAAERWGGGGAYRFNRSFGAAIKKHSWAAFDHYIMAFFDDRVSMNAAEIEAIKAIGGHKSKLTYNLSPGGDAVAENDKPLVGVNLKDGTTVNFDSGAQAARQLGLKSVDMPMAVARKERSSVADWWFRFLDDIDASPPEIWGEALRVGRVKELKSKQVVAINYETKEQRTFPSTKAAAVALEVSQSVISEVARGERHSAAGWWLKYADDPRKMPKTFGTMAAREKRDKKIFAVHLKTKDRRQFRNSTVASRKLGLHDGAAAAVASGRRTSAGGWWFSYDQKGDPPDLYGGSLIAKHRSKPVIAENLVNGKMQIYESAKIASLALGVHRSSISNIIKGARKSAKGYTFRFVEEEKEA